MKTQKLTTEECKVKVAKAAALDIPNNIILGLGSGSTALKFVEAIAKRIQDGLSVKAIATSNETASAARNANIEIFPLDSVSHIDIVVDGADEIDPNFNMIKGGGGCLLIEKIIAQIAKQMWVIIDEKKLVNKLGKFPLPIDVIPTGWTHTEKKIKTMVLEHCRKQNLNEANIKLERRLKDGKPFTTDNENFVLDVHGAEFGNPSQLAQRLNQIPGVVENGLFVTEASKLYSVNYLGQVSCKTRL